MIDILIRNADIIDGTNTPRYKGDIAIEGNRIADIGSLGEAAAETVIEAAGRVVAPGFIDMHSHADLSLLVEPEAESLVRQGITTVVTGQCSISPAPLAQEHREDVRRTIGMIMHPQVSLPWDQLSSFESFLSYLEQLKPSLHVVPLVGQGMIRAAVWGYRADRPGPDQVAQMQRLVREAMDCGAFGISTGLIYPPGSFTLTEELIEVVTPVGRRGGLYFSHIRGESETLLPALREAIEIGRQASAAVQISHFKAAGRANWDQAAGALDCIDQARSEGLDVTADMYPYTGGAGYLAVLLPKWSIEGGTPALLDRLERPEERTRIAEEMRDGQGGLVANIEWEKVLIGGSANRAYVGHTVSELAAQDGQDPYIWVLDVLLATRAHMQMVVLAMSEDNLRLQLGHPAIMLGTDGLGVSPSGQMAKGVMHPRFFGTYPRIFGQYVRDEGVLSLEEASWKASGFPAQKLDLADRGVIARGYKADLVVFDPATIQDQATYAEPMRFPAGIEYVLIDGEIAVEHDRQTDARAGKVIRRKP